MENVEKKRKTYFAESQRKYGEKCKKYAVKYIPTEMDKVKEIEKELEKCGMSANAWIKQAIDEKLLRDSGCEKG